MAYQTRLDLNGLDNQQFFMLVSEAAKNLGWTIQVVNENMMQLTTFKSAFSWGETVRVQIENETVFAESRFSRKQLSGNSRNRKNIEALTNQIELLRSQYSPSQLTELYQQQVAKEEAYAAGLAKRLEENNLTVSEKISLGVGGHYVTYTVIGINFAVFIIMIISGVDAMQPTVESLIKWGGNLRSSAVNGEWYRLFTNIFLHAGIIHLLFNMYALYYIGMFLEPMLSRWRFLALYISTGVIASATSIWWSGDRVSVGASGAIFGMYGVFLALLTTNL